MTPAPVPEPEHDDIIDDSEMPIAPTASAATTEIEIDGTLDSSLLEAVPGMGEAIPIGTYHFRLDSFTTGFNEPAKDSKTGLARYPDEEQFGPQPYFLLSWSCQQEPHTGRRVQEFCGWCTQEVFKAAAGGGNRTARRMVNNRLFVAKDLLPAIGLNAVGNINFKDLLATNPECKLQLKLQPGKSKDASGKYIPDGTMTNGVVKHVSLTRPS
jgi:hypothetical protein